MRPRDWVFTVAAAAMGVSTGIAIARQHWWMLLILAVQLIATAILREC